MAVSEDKMREAFAKWNEDRRIGPTHKEVWEAAWKAALTQQPESEPVAWMFQHEETGQTQCVDTQQVEWGFEGNNPRWLKVCPLYTSPQPSPREPDAETIADRVERATEIALADKGFIGHLLPCPFCGESDTHIERKDLAETVVACGSCGIYGPGGEPADDWDLSIEEEMDLTPGEMEARRCWNRRTAAPLHSEREWISCEERLPSAADSDASGDVWCRTINGDTYAHPWSNIVNHTAIYTHWMPTGLRRPEPPDGGE